MRRRCPYRSPRGVDRCADLGRMVRVVVDDRHARNLAEDLKAARGPAEVRACRRGDRWVDAGGGGEDQRRARVLRVVQTRKGQQHVERFRRPPLHLEPLHALLLMSAADQPVAPRLRAIGDHNAAGRVAQRQALGIVGAEREHAADRHGRGQFDERFAVRLEACVDVGVIQLQAGDARTVGPGVQEFRPRIPRRRRVLVALEDERARAQPRRAAEVERRRAEAEPGVHARTLEDVDQQR